MGRAVKRQTPRSMPTQARVDQFTKDLAKPFIVVGSRAAKTADNRKPDFDIHGTFRFATGASQSLSQLKGKNVAIFVHGYNVTTDEGLKTAEDFFSKLQTSLVADGEALNNWEFVLFTWPGDTGTIHFNVSQEYAQHSGVAIYQFFRAVDAEKPTKQSMIAHSLGVHVALRGLSILGERRFRGKVDFRVKHVLLLAGAVENDVFQRPSFFEEYHFPESAFGMEDLHIGFSRADNVLNGAFRVSERDRALGYSGPESNRTLVSLGNRVTAVLGSTERFQFELHDFSPRSATMMNPALHVDGHSDYWENTQQTDFYVNLIT
jgi:esterase/lipase superfamily enzyme